MLGLQCELVGGGRMRVRSFPPTGQPLDQGERPEGKQPAHLVASLVRRGLELLQEGAGSVRLPGPREAAPENVARAEVPLEFQPESLFDLDAALEETGSDLDV